MDFIKKTLFLAFSFLIMVELISSGEVGYILKNDRLADQNIIDLFNEMGLEVHLIEDNNLKLTNLNNFDLIFVGDERLRNLENIEISKYPSVIMNMYYGPEFGLTDVDGISQLASTEPMSVKVIGGSLNGIRQVYKQAIYDTNRVAIPYYYLEDENKVDTEVIARTHIGDSYRFGDVIALIPSGTKLKNNKVSEEKMCFYGISKTDYWTSYSEELFKQCVGGVLVKCSSDSECEDNNQYTKDSCVNPETINSYCKNEEIKCIFDSDCGVSELSPRYCNQSNVFVDIKEPKCLNAGETNSQCSFDLRSELVEKCSNSCLNGTCLNKPDNKLVLRMGSYYESEVSAFNQKCGEKPPVVRVYLDEYPSTQVDYLNYENLDSYVGQVTVDNKVLDKTNIFQKPGTTFNEKWQIYWDNFKDYEFDLNNIDLSQPHKIYVEYTNDCYGGGTGTSKDNRNLYISKVRLGEKEINLAIGDSVLYNLGDISGNDFVCTDSNRDGYNDCYDNSYITESCDAPGFHPTIRCGSFGWAGSIRFEFS